MRGQEKGQKQLQPEAASLEGASAKKGFFRQRNTGKASSRQEQGGYENPAGGGGDTARKIIFLQRINKGLFVAWGIVVVGAGIGIKNVHSVSSQDMLNHSEETISAGQPQKEQKIQGTPFSFYADIIGRKELFKIAMEEPKKEAPSAIPQVSPLELLSNYSLSGVVSGQAPQAIIEDKKSKKTYFLNKGQSLGEFKVIDIREGKVILGLNGQQYELNL